MDADDDTDNDDDNTNKSAAATATLSGIEIAVCMWVSCIGSCQKGLLREEDNDNGSISGDNIIDTLPVYYSEWTTSPREWMKELSTELWPAPT